MRFLLFGLVVLLALPAGASAATVSVEPYQEPPDIDPYGSCSRYMMCPPDMLVFRAAAGETNDVTIQAEESVGSQRTRFRVRDVHLEAGAGCELVQVWEAVCTAAAVGPVELGDGDDRIAMRQGWVTGGEGDDVLHSASGTMQGGAGDDVLIGSAGNGDAGDDLLLVLIGGGGEGHDVLKCRPRDRGCYLEGGPGDDLLTGGRAGDRLYGGAGRDVLQSRWGEDRLDCGRGRRDLALADEVDRVRRCERVRR